MDPGGFGPGAAPDAGYGVSGQRGEVPGAGYAVSGQRGEAPGAGYAVPGQRDDVPAPGYAGSGPGSDVPAPARPNRGLPIVIGVLAVVAVLCIGGGAAAYFFFVAEEPPAGGGERPAAVASASAVESAPATPAATAPASPTKQPADGEEEVSGDLSGYKQGDCLTVDEADDNKVEKAECTDPGAQKVLLRKNGTLDDSVCQSTEATFSLSQDAPGSARDFVLCVGPAD